MCIETQKSENPGWAIPGFSKNVADTAINSIRYLYLPIRHLSSLFFPQSTLFFQPAYGQGIILFSGLLAMGGNLCSEIWPGVVV